MYLFRIFYIFLSFTLAYITCKEKPELIEKQVSVKPDYLSETWVKKKIMEVDSNPSEQKNAKQKSEELMQKGILLYKSKKDLDAVILYEAANDSYPTGENYYHYGNSLANLNRLNESIEAYKISLLLKPKRPELASYNIACSYSRLGKVYEAYSHLADSIDMGYNAFAHIEKDPDMKNLREQPDWKEKINGLILSSKYSEESLYGVFEFYEPKIGSYYYLCRNKQIIEAFGNYPDCIAYIPNSGYLRGKWELKNGDVSIQYDLQCNAREIRDENAKENQRLKHCFGYQKKQIFRDCEKLNSLSHKIYRYDIKQAFQYQWFKKLSPEQEPKQCDPNFVPKTLEDLYVK